MLLYQSNARWLIALLFLMVPLSARESVLPIRIPESSVTVGLLGELRDDVYSADLNLAGEYAPCNCFSVYGDFSYRLASYEWDVTLHDQRHEALDLRVNGLNESYMGVKLVPYTFFGVDVSWRLPPREGSRVNLYHRLGVSPFGLYEFSRNMTLGASIEYFTFFSFSSYSEYVISVKPGVPSNAIGSSISSFGPFPPVITNAIANSITTNRTRIISFCFEVNENFFFSTFASFSLTSLTFSVLISSLFNFDNTFFMLNLFPNFDLSNISVIGINFSQ